MRTNAEYGTQQPVDHLPVALVCYAEIRFRLSFDMFEVISPEDTFDDGPMMSWISHQSALAWLTKKAPRRQGANVTQWCPDLQVIEDLRMIDRRGTLCGQPWLSTPDPVRGTR
jgi:hypothetical protein